MKFTHLPCVFLCALVLAASLTGGPARAADLRTLTDMRGKEVRIPAEPARIVTIDDGFFEGIMTHLGVIDRVKGIGSWAMKRDYRYTFPAADGSTYEHAGWNTMKYLHPWLDDLPIINSPQGNVINFESLAAVNPDLVLLRVGDCTVGAGNLDARERTAATIEDMGIPLVVTLAPSCFPDGDLSTMREEAAVIGRVFGQEAKAVALADRLAAVESMIRERTADIPEVEKPRVLYFGLNPSVRSAGGAGSVWGVDTPESYIIESVAGARNAYSGRGSGVPLSAEQVYALDPDVIVLPTANGYHPPRELYEAPYYANLAELRAVKNKQVVAMPWTPMNCARRQEYPLDMLIIAKAAWPDRFADITVHDFALALYKDLYGVDDTTALGLASTQLLDWMLDSDF